MLSRRDDHVPVKSRVLVEERHGLLVFVDHVVEVLGFATNKLADETDIRQTSPHPIVVEGDPLHPFIMAGRTSIHSYGEAAPLIDSLLLRTKP